MLFDTDARCPGAAPPRPQPARARHAPVRRRALAAVIASALLLPPVLLPPGLAAAQTDAEKSAARALAMQGGAALSASKYAEALDLVSRAEQLLHAPPHLLMIARAQVGLGRLVAAQETYLRLTREQLAPTAPGAFKRAQQEGSEELAALAPRIAQLRIVLEGAGQKAVAVKMDDQPVSPALVGVYWPVDPGKHEVSASAAGQSPVTASVELKDGERKEIKLMIPEVSLGPAGNPDGRVPPAGGASGPPQDDAGARGFFTPLRGVGIGLGALGVAGVVVGAVFLGKSASASSEADARFGACGKPCPDPERDAILALDADALRSRGVGIGALVGGGVALGAGVALFLIGKPAPRPAAAFVTPWFSGNAAGLRGTF